MLLPLNITLIQDIIVHKQYYTRTWGRQASTNCLKSCDIPQNLAKFSSNLRNLLIFLGHEIASYKEIIINKITPDYYGVSDHSKTTHNF